MWIEIIAGMVAIGMANRIHELKNRVSKLESIVASIECTTNTNVVNINNLWLHRSIETYAKNPNISDLEIADLVQEVNNINSPLAERNKILAAEQLHKLKV
jgi:hypothetical protein